jgi:non-ribosomal peptide synthetase component E (peptide arylation enzyme)
MSTPASMSFEPLTPTAFLKRSAEVFGDRVAVIDGDLQYTYASFIAVHCNSPARCAQ